MHLDQFDQEKLVERIVAVGVWSKVGVVAEKLELAELNVLEPEASGGGENVACGSMKERRALEVGRVLCVEFRRGT